MKCKGDKHWHGQAGSATAQQDNALSPSQAKGPWAAGGQDGTRGPRQGNGALWLTAGNGHLSSHVQPQACSSPSNPFCFF